MCLIFFKASHSATKLLEAPRR
ncbi:hypothetical protein LINGRAHAP2_LOCUS33925 [Linum grandiflorum]